MKYISTGSTASQPQLAIADFIAGGHYQPHVRRMRSQYQRSRDLMSDWVTRYFPVGTRISRPKVASCCGWNCQNISIRCG